MSRHIYTKEELVDGIEKELSWRKKELKVFKDSVPTEFSPKQTALLRCAIPIIYAHWEGFVKHSCELYLEYVSNRNEVLKNLKPQFIAIALRNSIQAQEINKISEIDFSLGTNEKTNIVEYVEKFIQEKTQIELDDVMHSKEYKEFGKITYTEKTRAVIKVQDGCDRFCSYCIIPYARGRVRSRNYKEIINEIISISKKGIKEIVITGIHIASYGKDFEEDYKLIDLLEEINKIEGIERIRLGSIEPLLITEEFLNRLKKLEKICEQFHLSLQSACNNTLERMNRRYTIEEFKSITKMIRDCYSNAILTTDIIVGFPGETDEEFDITYKNLKEINFYKMHVFKYSPRKGTKAAIMKNQISGDIKEKRSKTLIELSDKNEKEYQKKYIGQTVKVLFEEEKNGWYVGHTANYIVVKVKSNKDLSNEIIEIKITEQQGLELIGECI